MNVRLQPFVLVFSLATFGTALGETPLDTGSAPRQFDEQPSSSCSAEDLLRPVTCARAIWTKFVRPQPEEIDFDSLARAVSGQEIVARPKTC